MSCLADIGLLVRHDEWAAQLEVSIKSFNQSEKNYLFPLIIGQTLKIEMKNLISIQI